MFPYRSNVHGTLDLAGHVWKYGDINWVTTDQLRDSVIIDAVHRGWISEVTEVQLRQAMIDPSKKVGGKPTVTKDEDLANLVRELREEMRSDFSKALGEMQKAFSEIKESLANIRATGLSTEVAAPREATVVNSSEPIFIPSIDASSVGSLEGALTESKTHDSSSADDAIQALKKLKKSKNT